MTEVALAQSIAAYECGEGRRPLEFVVTEPSDVFLARSEDDLYDYIAVPADMPLTGTLFVRNRKTGEMKVIPVTNMLQIRRRCKLQQIEPVATVGNAELVSHFGSKAAKRIYNIRRQTVK
jgi:hypothetical protein